MSELEEKFDNIRQNLFPLPSVLYHYTDVKGFQGIIESSQWYATHYLYTNDSQEIIHGDNLIRSELENYHTGQCDPLFKKAIEESLIHNLFDASIYIAAFSEVKDSLDQWRAYGDDGAGYSIGIDPYAIIDKSIKFVKVTYSVEEQMDLVRKSMKKGCEVLEQALVNVSDEDTRQKIVSTIAEYLARLRFDLAISFKHHAFSNEKEWRVVFEKWEKLRGTTNHHAYTDICYRSAGGIVVPFMKLDFSSTILPRNKPSRSSNKAGVFRFSACYSIRHRKEQKLLPLNAIIIGPKHKVRQEQTKKSLEMQLRTKGYKENSIPIQVSEIPYQ